MKKNLFFVMILLIMISGCSVSNEEKEVINLKGESEHWKVEYVIRDSKEENKPYMIQCYISLKDESLVVNDLFFDIDSPGVVSHFGGTISSENNESVLINNLVSPSISSYFLPEKGEDIVVTIKWNKNNEEEIRLTP